MEAILLEVFLCDNYRVRTPQNSQEEMDADKRRGASQPACNIMYQVSQSAILAHAECTGMHHINHAISNQTEEISCQLPVNS